MRVLHWCMLGVTLLLLVSEVAISQVCKSLITLVDAFHTLFILLHMALPPPKAAGVMKPPPSSLASAASPHASSSSSSSAAPLSTLPAESSIGPLPGTPQPNHEASSSFNSHELSSPTAPAPALYCGVSFASGRVQTVGAFLSSLLLASLSTSYLMEIIGFFLDPQPVQRPLLLVVVGAVTLLHKTLVLGLNWDQLREERAGAGAGAGAQPEAESQLDVNHKVLAEGETKGPAESGRVPDDISPIQAAVDLSLHNGALVLCNPGTSSVPDTDSQTPRQQPGVRLDAAAPPDGRDCEVASGAADPEACECEGHSQDTAGISKDDAGMGHLDSQNASNASPSSHHTESPAPSSERPVCLQSLLLVAQGVFTSLLALINGLAMLLAGSRCLHSPGACALLVYLDPGLSMLAVIALIATATPQVHRYGMLLLQASPPHICVSDLGRRITGVPGVRAVHDLHVWQLTESFLVASVHVHCHTGFPAHRCADLMSGVTKVLQSVGVSCCTVQPEFTSCSAGGGGDAFPVVHREDPSLTPRPACSLACGKACAGNMCCSSLEEETNGLLAPPAGETKEEPQTLVIENTFL